jgi:hypothetical protein
VAQHPTELRRLLNAIGPVNSRSIEQAQYYAMEIPTGIDDSLEIFDMLGAARLHRVAH